MGCFILFFSLTDCTFNSILELHIQLPFLIWYDLIKPNYTNECAIPSNACSMRF